MTPHRSHSKGSFVVDLVFPPPIGRLRRSSGTTNAKVYRDIVAMLRALKVQARFDLLLQVKLGSIEPLHLLDLFRRNRLQDVPSGTTLPLLHDAAEAWILEQQRAGEISIEHARGIRKSVRSLEDVWRIIEGRDPLPKPKAGTAAAKVEYSLRLKDVPRALARCRTLTGEKQPTFNKARVHCQAVLRGALGDQHDLYAAVQQVKPFKKKRRKPRAVLEVADVVALVEKMSHQAAEITWSIYLTGMNPKEYFVDGWDVLLDRVHVNGEKRVGRQRDVPFVAMIAAPAMSRRAWENELRKVGERKWQARDLRRSTAHLWEKVGIVKSRRRWYLGHAEEDVTDGYEAHEVTAFLREDATRIKGALPETLQRLRVVS